MENRLLTKLKSGGIGRLINIIQTLFVSFLRIWSIPIVLLLSLASGFTTFYGMSYFITPWIALIITVAIQSIIVICSFELAGIHSKANRLRYFSVVVSLVIAFTASMSFSYFKFYEISEHDTIRIERINEVGNQVDSYLKDLIKVKSSILGEHKSELEKLEKELSQAYFGTHPEIPPQFRNIVGEGPVWKHIKKVHEEKLALTKALEQQFNTVDESIATLQAALNKLDSDTTHSEQAYQEVSQGLHKVQLEFNQLAAKYRSDLPSAPILMTYSQFTETVKPTVNNLPQFTLFPLIIAGMVDFFTVLLSYRLEFAAPGPLTEQEEELVFECLKQFSEFRINENDAVEIIIEKSEIEKARHYVDWPRMFAVGLLLSRGFLRKVDDRRVEFAPNLYPLIAEKMGDKLQQIKAQSSRQNSSLNS
jgi:Skp family chaperone for outer membrane proteins